MKATSLFSIIGITLLSFSAKAQNLANNSAGGVTFFIKFATKCKAPKDSTKTMTIAPGSALNIGNCAVERYEISDGTNNYTFDDKHRYGCVLLNGKDTWVITTPKKALVGGNPCPPNGNMR